MGKAAKASALYVGLLALLAPGVAQAATRFKVLYTARAQGIVVGPSTIGPVEMPPAEVDFVLHDKTVDFYADQGAGLVKIGTGLDEAVNFYGPAKVAFKTSARRLSLVGTWSTHQILGTIRTDGRSTCRASLRYKLLPGATAYHVEVPTVKISADAAAIEATDVRCQLLTE